jgi:hypothetical protein
VDFKSLLRPLSFRGGPAPDALPPPLVRPAPKRQGQATVRAVADLLAALPGPGETTHCFLLGRTDLCDYLDAVLARLGPARAVRISTLSLAPRNVPTLKRWADSGAAQRLTVLVSKFFKRHNPALFTALAEVLKAPHRAAASRTHAKLALFDFHDGGKLVAHGSGNLRCNGNVEQLSLTADAPLHDYFARFIDEYAQSNEDDNPPKG